MKELAEIFVLLLDGKLLEWVNRSSSFKPLKEKTHILAVLMFDTRELKRASAECALWWCHTTRFDGKSAVILNNCLQILCCVCVYFCNKLWNPGGISDTSPACRSFHVLYFILGVKPTVYCIYNFMLLERLWSSYNVIDTSDSKLPVWALFFSHYSTRSSLEKTLAAFPRWHIMSILYCLLYHWG